jgi:hypothetical protein
MRGAFDLRARSLQHESAMREIVPSRSCRPAGHRSSVPVGGMGVQKFTFDRALEPSKLRIQIG